ncbi:lipoprotein, putative [Pseudoalteromonas luteoviolacea B = ATCC 29581]|nr:lipoprotein, putative [Pseudoalteromonas luteoviolacea B = ATCC 29581]
MFKKLTLLAVGLSLSGCVIHIDANSGKRATERLTETLTLDAKTLSTLNADLVAGDITIRGIEGLDTITVEASILTTKEKNYEFSLTKSGKTAELIAHHNDGISWYSGNSPRIDLVVNVPSHFNLDIEDGSGDIDIQNVNGDLIIDDNSGDIDIIGGNNIEIEDGSGSINIVDSKGNVTLDDGSGDIRVVNVAGKVKIDDGSGDIVVDGANGLEIVDAGSGDLSINNINGKVQIAD